MVLTAQSGSSSGTPPLSTQLRSVDGWVQVGKRKDYSSASLNLRIDVYICSCAVSAMFSGIGILNWPLDVLLYMLSFCSLEDSLSFSMVCKEMYTLAAQKAFWITALKKERRIRPIACPYHEDLTTHDIHGLRRIALHTRRLDRNWDSDKPQVLGPINTVSLGFPTLEILFQVPGTKLYLLHCHIRGIVELWHVGLRKVVSGPFSISTEVCDISQVEDLSGRLTMALLVRKEDCEATYQIALICVEYGPPVFTLTVSLLCDLPLGSRAFYWAIFLDHDIVGALSYSDDARRLSVSAINRTTGKTAFIVTDIPNTETSLDETQIFQSGTTIVDGNLCILIANSWVFTVPNNLLPHDDNPDSPSVSMFRFEGHSSHFNNGNDDDRSSLIFLTANSPYGVSAMAVNVVESIAAPCALKITFWIQPESSTDSDKIPLVPCTSESMPGFFYNNVEEGSNRWESLVQTLSGRKGLVLVNVRDEADENDSRGAPTLRLINCESHKPQTTYRDLVLPDFINLFTVRGLFLDDHLGVVSLIDSSGVLYTIPYA